MINGERLAGSDAMQHDLFSPGDPIPRHDALNDMVNLARVLELISDEHNDTKVVMQFMRVLRTLFDSVRGDKIANQTMLIRRFRNRYGEEPDEEFIGSILRRLDKAGWMYHDRSGFVISDIGIRYFGEIIILANKSVSYYSKESLEQKLYMAEMIAVHIKLLQRTDVSADDEITAFCYQVETATTELKRDLHLFLQNKSAIRQISSIHELLQRVVQMLREIIDSTVQAELLQERVRILEHGQRTYLKAQEVCDVTLTEALRLSRLLNDNVRYSSIDEKEFHDALVQELRQEFTRTDASTSPLTTLLLAAEAEEIDAGQLGVAAWLVAKIPGAISAQDWEAALEQNQALFDMDTATPLLRGGALDLSGITARQMTAAEIEEIEQLGSMQRESDEVERELHLMLEYLKQHASRYITLYECILGSPVPGRHGASIFLDLLSEFGRIGWLELDFSRQITWLPDLDWTFSERCAARHDPRFHSLVGFERIRIPTVARLQRIQDVMKDPDGKKVKPEEVEHV